MSIDAGMSGKWKNQINFFLKSLVNTQNGHKFMAT